MAHSAFGKGISQFVPGWRAEPGAHVTQLLDDDWLSGRGVATEEGAFPRGLREGPGGAKRGWALRVMAVPCPRVHLYRSLGPVTKASRRCRCPLPPAGPGGGEGSATSRPRCSGKPLRGRGRGGRLRDRDVCEGREQPLEPGSERPDWGRGQLRAGVWERVALGRAREAAETLSSEARAGGA